MKPLRHPDQLTAMQRQIALEQQAQQQRQAAHEALLASMPPDLAASYQVGLGLEEVRKALLAGMFPTMSHGHVAELREFMHAHVLHYDGLICAHPRFAEFFPAAAAKLEAGKLQAEALDVPPVLLVGPDGAPLDLEPAPGIIHLEHEPS